MADFITLTETERLQAFILLRTSQLRAAKKQMKKLLVDSSSSSHQVAPHPSDLPLPPFAFAPLGDDWLDMLPSVALGVEEEEDEVVFLPAAAAAEEHVVPAAAEEVDDASESKGSKKRSGPHRKIKTLATILASGTPIFIESLGDRWEGAFLVSNSVPTFLFNGTEYTSPAAVCKAHAARITEAHPKTTKPGNGWDYIVVAATGKTIGELYDAANAV